MPFNLASPHFPAKMRMSAGGTLPMSSNRAWNGVQWLGGAFLNAAPCEQKEDLVRKVTMTLTAAVLLLGTMALQASAQNQQRGAASIHALRNATPIVTPAACYGGTGYCGCGPG
jgi:hypothetical protein